jgi:hypothetical protein
LAAAIDAGQLDEALADIVQGRVTIARVHTESFGKGAEFLREIELLALLPRSLNWSTVALQAFII